MSVIRSLLRFTATTLEELLGQVNTYAERHQNGSMAVLGVKLDLQRTAAPVDAPRALEPNLVGATVGGVCKIYWWNGAAWVAVI